MLHQWKIVVRSQALEASSLWLTSSSRTAKATMTALPFRCDLDPSPRARMLCSALVPAM